VLAALSTSYGKRIADVRFGSKADIRRKKRDVRFTPKSGHQKCASSHSPRLMAAQQLRQLGDIGRDPQRQTAARDVTTRHRQECQNSGSMMQV